MKIRHGLLTAVWLLSLGATGTAAYLSAGAGAGSAEPSAVARATPLREVLAPAETQRGGELERLKTSFANLENRLERSEAALMRLSSMVETLAGGQDGSTGVGSENPGVKRKPLTSAQIERINRRQREKDAERLNDDFQQQAYDSEWSPQAAALIAERLTNNRELPGVELLVNECRASLCRIEVLVADAEQKLQFEDKLPLLLGEMLPQTTMFDEAQPDGSIRSVIYFGRGNG
ncbi:MAG: hypothetical protein ACU837_14975 [Gammaproteobacteria bacterium]